MSKTRKHFILFFSLFLTLLILDQASKIYVKTHFYLGEEINVFSDWFKLAFTENPGAAFGIALGGEIGKYILTIFRIIFSGFIAYILIQKIKEHTHKGFLIAVTLILAGAVGNVIDGIFYGLIFSASSYHSPIIAELVPFGTGYAGLFQGKVVDMLYFPMITSQFPSWVPKYGGEYFTFFSPIFNVADSCISVGLGLLLIFMNKVDIEN